MKLIILNGSPAAGKTTLAGKLHQDIPMSLLADVDVWRKMVSGWEKDRETSLDLAYKFSVGGVEAYLKTGNSVIVDKAILSDNSVIDALISAGERNKAEVYEFILTADKETIIRRADERGYESGLLTPESVKELWETTQKLIEERPDAHVIDTTNLGVNEAYQKVNDVITN